MKKNSEWKKEGGGCFVAVNVITPIHETESNHENVCRDNLQYLKKNPTIKCIKNVIIRT